jgi:hypothetical protein
MFSDSEMDKKEWKLLSEEQNNPFHHVFCRYREGKFAKVKETEQEDWKV